MTALHAALVSRSSVKSKLSFLTLLHPSNHCDGSSTSHTDQDGLSNFSRLHLLSYCELRREFLHIEETASLCTSSRINSFGRATTVTDVCTLFQQGGSEGCCGASYLQCLPVDCPIAAGERQNDLRRTALHGGEKNTHLLSWDSARCSC